MGSDALCLLEGFEALVKVDEPGFTLAVSCYDVELSWPDL